MELTSFRTEVARRLFLEKGVGRDPVLGEVTGQPSPGADGEGEDGCPKLRGWGGPKAGPLPIACRSWDLSARSFPPGRRSWASCLTAPPHSPAPRGRSLS